MTMSILQPTRIKDRQAIDEIRALAPDVIVVMAYGQILPREVLKIPRPHLSGTCTPRFCRAGAARRRFRPRLPRAIERPGSRSCTWMKDSIPATSCCNARSKSRRTKRADRSMTGWRKSRRMRCSNLCGLLVPETRRALRKTTRSPLMRQIESRRWPHRLVGTGGSDRAKNSRLQSVAGRLYWNWRGQKSEKYFRQRLSILMASRGNFART